MPRVKTTYPRESREKGERNIQLPEIWLPRYMPAYYQPEWLQANTWRKIVESKPQLTICRDTIISSYLSLDWKIEPVDSDQRDELKPEIDYYTKLFTSQNGWDYDNVVEWVGKDLLDLPFGAAAEVGKEYDSPMGQTLWFEPLDGATLFPTRNKEYPVGQKLVEAMKDVYFPAHAINRIYYSPRTNIHKHGWGTAPPERIYFAIELVARGDLYYAKLLLDTPEAGILDLRDMAQDSAEEWVAAWREMNGGVDPYKVAVLYEHEQEAKFIPFQRSPTEIMFDVAINKYMTIICAGYGISMSDIGFSSRGSGGETLAGTIRDERRTRRTGFAIFKKKMTMFWNRMLPEYLKYKVIDTDEEFSVAMTRARLGGATAATAYIDKRVFSPAEMRMQAIADGLITVSVPEEPPDESEFPEMSSGFAERPNTLGRPIAPSAGGQGEVRGDLLTRGLLSLTGREDKHWRKMMFAAFPVVQEYTKTLGEVVGNDDWLDDFNVNLWSGTDVPIQPSNAEKAVLKSLDGETWYLPGDVEEILDELNTFVNDTLYDIEQTYDEIAYISGTEPMKLSEFDRAKLGLLVQDWMRAIPVMLSKSVVCGLVNYLAHNPETELENVFENNQMLSWVQNVANSATNVLIRDISSEISDIIKATLEKEEKVYNAT